MRHAVDDEVGVEDFVAAVLGIGLRKHHQFDIAGVALQAGEGVDQVIHLVIGQCQAKLGVGGFQSGAYHRQAHPHAPSVLRVTVANKPSESLRSNSTDSVMRSCRSAATACSWSADRLALPNKRVFQSDGVFGQPLDAFDGQAAVVGNVAGFGGPGRYGAQARGDDDLDGIGRFDQTGSAGSP